MQTTQKSQVQLIFDCDNFPIGLIFYDQKSKLHIPLIISKPSEDEIISLLKGEKEKI